MGTCRLLEASSRSHRISMSVNRSITIAITWPGEKRCGGKETQETVKISCPSELCFELFKSLELLGICGHLKGDYSEPLCLTALTPLWQLKSNFSN